MKAQCPSAVAASRRRVGYLDAAEQAFIRYGYEGASMRRIAGLAGVGVGTITHHWQSKEALLMEVFERRLSEPLRLQEEGLLACARRYADGGTVDLKDLVLALLRPLYVPGDADAAATECVHRLFSFLITEPSATVLDFNKHVFGRVGFVFYEQAQKIVPACAPEVLHWLFCCTVGCNVFPLSLGDRVSEVTGEPRTPPDWNRVADTVAEFIVAGIRHAPQHLR